MQRDKPEDVREKIRRAEDFEQQHYGRIGGNFRKRFERDFGGSDVLVGSALEADITFKAKRHQLMKRFLYEQCLMKFYLNQT